MVGGTGTGKSTSLAAMINHRNENSYGHILTVEDPIEFVHPHKNCIITQREVGVDTESWEAALKNSLRQAPDVILLELVLKAMFLTQTFCHQMDHCDQDECTTCFTESLVIFAQPP